VGSSQLSPTENREAGGSVIRPYLAKAQRLKISTI
jgi:hypothetical protein